MDQVQNQIPNMDFTETPTDSLLPDLFYNFVVSEVSTMESGSNKTHCPSCGVEKGKKMITVKFKVLEPTEYAEAEMMEFYNVGIEGDPCAHSTSTLALPRNFGAINFGLLLDATQTPRNQIASLVGKRCQRATIQTEIDDKKNGGTRVVNNFARGARGSMGVYPVGTVAVGQATPAENYPRGKGGSQAKQTNGAGTSVPAASIACPRCKKEFPEDQLSDHMADCLGS